MKGIVGGISTNYLIWLIKTRSQSLGEHKEEGFSGSQRGRGDTEERMTAFSAKAGVREVAQDVGWGNCQTWLLPPEEFSS